MLYNFLKDEYGAVVSTELVLASALLISGISIGLKNVRDSINIELKQLSKSIMSIDASYSFNSISSGSSYVGGSNYTEKGIILDTNE